MQLTLTVLRCPDTVAPETRNVPGGEFSVGRGPGVDWVLPDPERLLSKRHFAVAFRSGTWQLADTSTNGTFLNREGDPIGGGDVRSLRDGDRLRVGAYEIEVRLTEEQAPRAGSAGGSAFGDPFSMDPFAPAQPQRNPFDEPPQRGLHMASSSAQLPADFDPLTPDEHDAPFRGPTQADNSPVMQDAFRPPAPAGQMPLHAGGVIPGDDLLPDDWDKDLLEGIGSGPEPAPLRAAPPHAPPPVQYAPTPQHAPAPQHAPPAPMLPAVAPPAPAPMPAMRQSGHAADDAASQETGAFEAGTFDAPAFDERPFDAAPFAPGTGAATPLAWLPHAWLPHAWLPHAWLPHAWLPHIGARPPGRGPAGRRSVRRRSVRRA
ncbi:MAG: FHA domain-containing protein [Acetobacteraceae bacterium]